MANDFETGIAVGMLLKKNSGGGEPVQIWKQIDQLATDAEIAVSPNWTIKIKTAGSELIPTQNERYSFGYNNDGALYMASHNIAKHILICFYKNGVFQLCGYSLNGFPIYTESVQATGAKIVYMYSDHVITAAFRPFTAGTHSVDLTTTMTVRTIRYNADGTVESDTTAEQRGQSYIGTSVASPYVVNPSISYANTAAEFAALCHTLAN